MYKKQKQDSKTTRWKPEKSHHNAIPYKRVEKYKSNWMDDDFRF